MRIYHVIVSILTGAGLLILQQAAYAESISLEEAMQQAGDTHPEVRMADQSVAAAEGMLTEKSAYAYNPQVLIKPQRRWLAGGRGITTDYFIFLSQKIEIPGKRSSRSKAAKANLDAAEDSAMSVRQRRMIAAARAAVTLDFATLTEKARQQQQDIMRRLLKAVRQSFKAGEKSVLDVNLALASFASSLSLASRAKQFHLRAKRDMANALGLPGKRRRQLRVTLPPLNPDWKPPKNAVELALSSRPDLQAVKANTRAGAAQVQLASLNRIPDPEVGLLTARDSNDHIFGFRVFIPLPVLNLHAGAYKAAIARRERARDLEQWSIAKLKREVATVINEYRVTARTLTDFRKGQGEAAEENIRLAQIAFENGEMDLADLIIYLDRGLQARITRLKLFNQTWQARIRVAAVLGHPEYIFKGNQK